MEVLDSRESPSRTDRYMMATSILAQYLNSKLPACVYSYTSQIWLASAVKWFRLWVFYMPVPERIGLNRRWLAQFILDESMNQTPSVEIMSVDPTGLNSTSGVT